jgi:hypothetical protein
VCSVYFIVCVVLCAVFCFSVVCYLCVVSYCSTLPPGKNPFAVKINSDNVQICVHNCIYAPDINKKLFIFSFLLLPFLSFYPASVLYFLYSRFTSFF